jgi:hypothetical protein
MSIKKASLGAGLDEEIRKNEKCQTSLRIILFSSGLIDPIIN